MTKHLQKTQTDCVRTCIACILDILRDEVPDFTEYGDGWYDSMQSWLYGRNLTVVQVGLDQISLPFVDVPCIGVGITTKGNMHAVVSKLTQNGIEQEHNPLPGSQIYEITRLCFLIPTKYGQSN